MSLRARYVGAISAITLATLGVAFTAVSVAVNSSQERQLDLALRAEADEEAAEAAALGGDELAISDRPGPAANDSGPLTKYAVIYATDGAVLARTPSWQSGPPALAELPPTGDAAFDLWAGAEHLRAVHVLLPAEHPGNSLLLAAPRTDLDGDEGFLGRAMAAVFGLAVLWTVLVAIVAVRRLSRGQQQIAAVARHVAAGDLDARVRMTSGDPEVVQLAHDVDHMIDRLGLLLGLQQRFVANAAHELRSPLTTLYGELSLALRRSREPAEYERAIREALDSTQRLRRLAEDLLAAARLGAAPDVAAEPVQLAELAAEAIALVAPEAEARGVDVRWHGADASTVGRAPDLLRLLRNLIENAVRHSPPGGRVVLAAHRLGDRVELRVEDAGPGVPASERERIFEAFYRGAEERAAGQGTGLGLTIAREISRVHGGDIEVTAAASGIGACFVVGLPAAGPHITKM